MSNPDTADDLPSLSISYETVCRIAAKARQFSAKDVLTDVGTGSDDPDEGYIQVLEDHADDPVMVELKALITPLSEDARLDLMTLAMLGCGDGDVSQWAELREEAGYAHLRHATAYLISLPLLSDYLEEGLAQFGRSCEDLGP